MQSCDLTKKEIEIAVLECEKALNTIKEEIIVRLKIELNKDKKELLEKLIKVLN